MEDRWAEMHDQDSCSVPVPHYSNPAVLQSQDEDAASRAIASRPITGDDQFSADIVSENRHKRRSQRQQTAKQEYCKIDTRFGDNLTGTYHRC